MATDGILCVCIVVGRELNDIELEEAYRPHVLNMAAATQGMLDALEDDDWRLHPLERQPTEGNIRYLRRAGLVLE